MTIRALCLASSQESRLSLFARYCNHFELTESLAQAAAIFGRNSDVTISAPHINLIVADVPAGGINLAEYVLARIRPNPYFGAPVVTPYIVMYDPTSDVSAARRALQLGVHEYLLNDNLTESYVENLLRGMDFTRFAQPAPDPVDWASAVDPALMDSMAYYGQKLSSVEAAIVNCLSANSGQAISARAIVHQVMGRDVDEERAASLIRPHISRLRSKVEPTPQMPQRLLTVRGKGYMYVAE
jgi:hypothetical protein